MKIFTTQDHNINISMIESLDKFRGVITMINGNKISLSHTENKNLISILEELHRQECQKG